VRKLHGEEHRHHPLPPRNQVQIFWLDPTGNMAMENLIFENIRINGEESAESDQNHPRTTPGLQSAPDLGRCTAQRRDARLRPARSWRPRVGEFVPVPGDGPYNP